MHDMTMALRIQSSARMEATRYISFTAR